MNGMATLILAWCAFQLLSDIKTDDWDKRRVNRNYVAGCVALGGAQYGLSAFVSAFCLGYQNIVATMVAVIAIGACIAVDKLVVKKFSERWHKIVLTAISTVSILLGFVVMYLKQGA